MTLFERISELAKKQHIGLKELAVKLGLSESAIYQWRKSSPKSESLEKVADYFHTTTDYLLGRTDDPNIPSTPEEDFGELVWDEDAQNFVTPNTVKESNTPEYFAIQRKSKKLNQKDQQRLLKIMEATFDDLDNGNFEEDDDDDL
ncbi:helix-turn-helix transcriptional regulator [Enterococcus avium]|uniref:helix-turn-helix domain-containing protein n=1 Tax=Enterococcus avium TaxID=33945 RepID=UPI00288D275F|nr:helix-turn-helix transcriptional regulator [Enterococcus avium]MDT2480930.1 helix-turn-helix transcriptional regulator [Enterococcus avium]MDT2500301.1 helix-turn-helix transcriptional regulator [Enterococcus avium]